MKQIEHIPKGIEDTRLRQANDKFIWNEFEQPQAAFGESQDGAHSSPQHRDSM